MTTFIPKSRSHLIDFLTNQYNSEKARAFREKIDPERIKGVIEEANRKNNGRLHGKGLALLKDIPPDYLETYKKILDLKKHLKSFYYEDAVKAGNKQLQKFYLERNFFKGGFSRLSVYCLDEDDVESFKTLVEGCKNRRETIDIQLQEVFNDACFTGKKRIAQYLLTNHESALQLEKVLPLHIACESGHLEIVKLLVEAGLDVQSENEKGENCFHIAAKCGQIEVLEYLINLKAGNAFESILSLTTSLRGRTLMDAAAESDQWEIVKYLEELGFLITDEIIDRIFQRGNNVSYLIQHDSITLEEAFSKACASKNKSIIEHLIDSYDFNIYTIKNTHEIETLVTLKILDPLKRDLLGNTPLHLCCEEGNLEMAKILVEKHKMNPEEKNPAGESVFSLICKKNLTAFSHYFFHIKNIPLTSDVAAFAIQYGNRQFLKTIPFNHADLLFYAVKCGNMEAVQYLIEDKGKSPLEKTQNKTPFALACRLEKTDVVVYLIRKFKSVLLKNDPLAITYWYRSKNETFLRKVLDEIKPFLSPLDLERACTDGNLFLVRAFLDEMKWEFQPKEGHHLVWEALSRGHHILAKELFERGLYTEKDLSFAIPYGNGYEEVALWLLDKEVDPNVKKSEFPLLLACKNEHKDLAVKLIEKEAYLHVVDSEGNTPLELAVEQGMNPVVKKLLERRAPHKKDLVKIACANGKFTTLQLLREKGLELKRAHYKPACLGGSGKILQLLEKDFPIDWKTEGADFMYLAYQAHLPYAVSFLKKAGLSPTLADKEGNTPLHYACVKGRLRIVKLHVDTFKLSFQNIKNKKGHTPFQAACRAGQLEVVRYFIEEKSVKDPNTLLHAAYSGNLNLVRYLIEERKINPQPQLMGDVSPLEIASEEGHLEVAEYLIQNKNCPIGEGINKASRRGHLSFIRSLLEILPPQNLICPLIEAVQAGQKDLVKFYLEEKGVETSGLQVFQGISSNQIKVCRYLLKNHVKFPLEMPFAGGNGPFHLLKPCKELLDWIRLFLEYRVPVNLQNKEGETPLHCIVKMDLPDVVEAILLLLKAGADPNVYDLSLKIPLFYAIEKGNPALVLTLLRSGSLPLPLSTMLDYEELAKAYVQAVVKNEAVCFPIFKYISPFVSFLPGHFTNVEEVAIDPAKVPKLDFVKELDTLFNLINFTDPKKEGYFDPKKIRADKVLLSLRYPDVVQELKKQMEVFATKVKHRGKDERGKCNLVAAPPLDRTGNETPQRKQYFDQLQTLLALTIEKIKGWDADATIRNEHLVEFAIAGYFCGNRYLEKIQEAYEELLRDKPMTFEERVCKFLTRKRLEIVKKLSTFPRHTTYDLHTFNAYLVHLKKARGIPHFMFEGDSANPYHLTEGQALANFDKNYNTEAIVNTLKEAFNGVSSDLKKDDMIDWFQVNLPEDWKKGIVLDESGQVTLRALLTLLAELQILDISPLVTNGFFDLNPEEVRGRNLLDVLDDEEKALALIDQGASLSVVDSFQRAALQIAVTDSTLGVVRALIRKRAKLNAKDRNGYSALHEAAEMGDEKMVSCLLQAGAKVNIKTKNKKTPLHLAKTEAVYDLLVQHKADERLLDSDGKSAAYYASFKGTKKRRSYFADREGRTPLHEACLKGDTETVIRLHFEGASLDTLDKKGVSPVHSACEGGSLKTVLFLAAFKASIKALTGRGESGLHFACRSQCPPEKSRNPQNRQVFSEESRELVKYLISLGLNPEQVDERGLTPLYIALASNRMDLAEILLANGAKWDAMSKLHFS